MNELYHYGIKGQHWGQRNGPPYPLSSTQKSSEEKKFGVRSGIKNHTNSMERNKNDDERKKLVDDLITTQAKSQEKFVNKVNNCK